MADAAHTVSPSGGDPKNFRSARISIGTLDRAKYDTGISADVGKFAAMLLPASSRIGNYPRARLCGRVL